MRSRRKFIHQLGTGVAAIMAAPMLSVYSCNSAGKSEKNAETKESSPELFFKISLAEWSLYRALFSRQLDHLDFPLYAKQKFDIDAVEYVNQFFMDKAKDRVYLGELKKRCDDHGITSVLIMCDLEGDLGDADKNNRQAAVENHYKWVEAAKFLGCHAIRVNAAGEGGPKETGRYVVESLTRLAAFASDFGISVIVENHGGYSSDGAWLSGIMKQIALPNCGTLPDVGNFCIKRNLPTESTVEAYLTTECLDEYDRYKGLKELMPFAKGVSAKTYDFDEQDNETTIDYRRVLNEVRDAKFSGYIGIEYEGHRLPADEGILKTKALLERIGRELT
jgi:Sugar phosphate isomerases/epimerases